MDGPEVAAVRVQRRHLVLNLPVVATGIAGLCQLAFGRTSINYEATTDRATQILVAILFIISALLVVAGWVGSRSKCELRQDMALRVKGTGLVGWSVGMLSYLAANWGLMDSPSQFFTSPATWVIAALVATTLHRAWVLLRPARRSER